MSTAQWYAVLASASAFVCFLLSLRAALRHPPKRWIWVMSCIMSLYFGVTYAGVATGYFGSLAIVSILVRPALGPLFIVFSAHALFDARRRPS